MTIVDKDAPALLAVERVSLSFRGVTAISDVGFTVRAREICAIIGPNGAGKSSMLNVINGVYRPQAGILTLTGASSTQCDLIARLAWALPVRFKISRCSRA